MLARRLAAYTGVMQARLIALERDEDSGHRPAPGRSSAPVAVKDSTALHELDELGLLDR